MKRLLLHIGYPKAASTSVQNGLFLTLHRQGAINFLGRAFESRFYGVRRNKADYKYWFDHVVDYTPYDPQNSLGPLSDNKVNVLSEGLFMMNERHGGSIVGPNLLQKYFAPQAEYIDVLLVVRRQQDLIASYYTQNYRRLENKIFADYVAANEQRGWTGEAKIFNYYEVARAYAAVFGKERVHVVLFEDFVHDKTRFSARLAPLLGVDAARVEQELGDSHLNQTIREEDTIVIKKLNARSARQRLIKLLETFRLKSAADALRIRIPAVSDADKQAIFRAFKDSNSKLAEEFGLDKSTMRQYGYF